MSSSSPAGEGGPSPRRPGVVMPRIPLVSALSSSRLAVPGASSSASPSRSTSGYATTTPSPAAASGGGGGGSSSVGGISAPTSSIYATRSDGGNSSNSRGGGTTALDLASSLNASLRRQPASSASSSAAAAAAAAANNNSNNNTLVPQESFLGDTLRGEAAQLQIAANAASLAGGGGGGGTSASASASASRSASNINNNNSHNAAAASSAVSSPPGRHVAPMSPRTVASPSSPTPHMVGGSSSARRNSPYSSAAGTPSNFLSPRLEATVQLLQEGIHDVNDNEFENESQAAAIAGHKESILDSTRRREAQKQKTEKTHAEMREALSKANSDISILQKKLKALSEERDGMTKKYHAEKLKVVDVQEDLEETQELNQTLREENEKQATELADMKGAIEERARRRAAMRKWVQSMTKAFEAEARALVEESEAELRSMLCGGASTAQAAIELFIASKGREGPFWMVDGAKSFEMLIKQNPALVPRWLEEVVMKQRRDRNMYRHQHVQTYETAETRRQDAARSDSTIDALKQELRSLQQELDNAAKDTQRARSARDTANKELDDARRREKELARQLKQRQQDEENERKRITSELEARDEHERFLKNRITDLEREIDRIKNDVDKERNTRSQAVRTAVWIEQCFQLLEDEERERRRRILLAEAEEAASKLAPLHATLVHEALRQRRDMIHVRSHLRSLTPPRSMSGVTGKRPWYPPPGPGVAGTTHQRQSSVSPGRGASAASSHYRYVSPSSSSAQQQQQHHGLVSSRSGTPTQQHHHTHQQQHSSSKSPARRPSPSVSSNVSTDRGSASAFSRVNSARLAVSVDQMQSLLEDLQQYVPVKKTRVATDGRGGGGAASLRPKSWDDLQKAPPYSSSSSSRSATTRGGGGGTTMTTTTHVHHHDRQHNNNGGADPAAAATVGDGDGTATGAPHRRTSPHSPHHHHHLQSTESLDAPRRRVSPWRDTLRKTAATPPPSSSSSSSITVAPSQQQQQQHEQQQTMMQKRYSSSSSSPSTGGSRRRVEDHSPHALQNPHRQQQQQQQQQQRQHGGANGVHYDDYQEDTHNDDDDDDDGGGGYDDGDDSELELRRRTTTTSSGVVGGVVASARLIATSSASSASADVAPASSSSTANNRRRNIDVVAVPSSTSYRQSLRDQHQAKQLAKKQQQAPSYDYDFPSEDDSENSLTVPTYRPLASSTVATATASGGGTVGTASSPSPQNPRSSRR